MKQRMRKGRSYEAERVALEPFHGVINVKFPLQHHQKYYITQYEELGFSYTQMKDDYTTNSHYFTYTFLFKGDGRMYFLSLGMKSLTEQGFYLPLGHLRDARDSHQINYSLLVMMRCI